MSDEQSRRRRIDHAAEMIAELFGYSWANLREEARFGGMDRDDFRRAALVIMEGNEMEDAARLNGSGALVPDSAGRDSLAVELERDAARWRQIDFVEGSVVTVRGTRISNTLLPRSRLGEILDDDRKRT